MYQNIVSQLLLADDANMFISGKNVEVLPSQMNEDLGEIQEWLNCSKFSLNVLKTHYMIFTPRNKIIEDIGVQLIALVMTMICELWSSSALYML